MKPGNKLGALKAGSTENTCAYDLRSDKYLDITVTVMSFVVHALPPIIIIVIMMR
jgi:hypothetical protein